MREPPHSSGEAFGEGPAWRPDPAERERSNLARLMRDRGLADVPAVHAWSVADRGAFWGDVVRRLGVAFARPPDAVLDLAGGPEHPRWLPGAELNVALSCFQGDPARVAVLEGREGTEEVRATTLAELRRTAERCAGGLAARGLEPGDAVALYMPMTAACVAAYLGVVLAGCRVVSVADSFVPAELARRLAIAGARAVVTQDVYRRAGKDVRPYERVRAADAPPAIVVAGGGAPAPLRAGDVGWEELLDAGGACEVDLGPPERVTNVLFSSGTTGDPKAIPWTHLTPIKCAMDAHLHQDVRAGDVVAWPTNVGWMMGPWLIYGALVNRASIALFEGAPTGTEFLRFVEGAGVNVLGLVPSLVRAWRASGATAGVDWSRVRVMSSTGEPSSASDYRWLMETARAPVIEYCGGTEIGGGYAAGTVLQPAVPATFTTPAFGVELVVLDDRGRPVSPGGAGEVFLVPPSIGFSQELLNRDHHAEYHAGCPRGPGGAPLRRHGDELEVLGGGAYRARGRVDDTMNLGGIKVSSVELEAVLARHPAVHEAAAVAVRPAGEAADALVVFAVLAKGADAADLGAELGALLARELNPLFRVRDVVEVDELPRTASNKLLRRELRARWSGSA